MTPFAIAGIQMNVSAVRSNIPAMQYHLEVLMSIYPWVQMVVFSELCAHGPLTTNTVTIPSEMEGTFSRLAKKHGIWILPGSVFEKRGDHILNTASVINPDGEIVGRYSKMFPFMPYEEGVTGGEEFLVFDVPEVGRFGVSICYDMWFPETSRTLACMGAEVILHPTLTGTIDREIELSVVRATAAINQCYVIDINGLGAGGNGRSLICGPDGRVIYQATTIEELIPIEVDLERVRSSRDKGVLRLGQPLKSFRDSKVHFDIYDRDAKKTYLDSLGPLDKPTRTEAMKRVMRQSAANFDLQNENLKGKGADPDL